LKGGLLTVIKSYDNCNRVSYTRIYAFGVLYKRK